MRRELEGEVVLGDGVSIGPHCVLRDTTLAAGTQVRPFPRPLMEAFYRASQTMYQEIGAGNANFKRMHDHYSAFQREAVSWMRFTENSFDDFMANVLRG